MASVSPILEKKHHDHRRCAAEALHHAEETASREGLRLTEQRRAVLAALLQSHVPASAYEVIDRLVDENGRRPAPITVYRALDFLVEHRFAHRIESRNAYVACDRGADCAGETTLFLLCERCGAAGEASSAALDGVLTEIASKLGFKPSAPVIEITGLCAKCREA